MAKNDEQFEKPKHHDTIEGIPDPSSALFRYGHDRQCHFLMNAYCDNTLHHGLLWVGDHGIGKATTAFHFVNWVLHQRPEVAPDALPAPDPDSPTYRQLAQGANPNIMHITRPLTKDGKGFRTQITIEEIRKIQHFLSLSASGGAKRFVIIDPANDMNRNAANALLKMLEEPPKNVHFILIAHGTAGLLPTIRSRTQMLKFDSLTHGQIDKVLSHYKPEHAGRGNEALMLLAEGSARRAITMIDYGGPELDHAILTLLSQPRFDVETAHKLGDVAADRKDSTHDELLFEFLIRKIRDEALLRARGHDSHSAAQLAKLEMELFERRRIAQAFNMDRKQELLVMLANTHSLFNQLAA